MKAERKMGEMLAASPASTGRPGPGRGKKGVPAKDALFDSNPTAKELKSLALTAADWAKRKGMGEAAIQHCRSYALEAERKMGQMLAATERANAAKEKRKRNYRKLFRS